METTAYTGSTRWPELVVNKIQLTEPFEWLARGWKDMRDAGRYSLMYGAGIVLISGLLTFALFATDNLFLLPFLVAGFFLIAPFLGIGLYQMSAHLERGEPLKTCNALEAWKSNHTQISIITVGFLIITQLWIASNFMLFALLYEGISPPIGNFISNVFLSEKGMTFSIASITVGFLFAWCAYVISVITVPMLIDRKVDGFTAIRFSIKSVLKNMPAMMLWAFLIVLIVGLGLMTYYVGLIVALPLIGHGSWHAYRSLVPSA
ncbi:MAG: DUF2189 domain-containing protein [Candidatus Thiodiazotropha sp. (ex Ustalcina ferruginea)]|nr:DUF2189 domain-containing protein [Candidatus Thiodiazotropha sp. (ex Ustalcina ferruginea)]